eukprot:347532-Amphidinium_carterae.1
MAGLVLEQLDAFKDRLIDLAKELEVAPLTGRKGKSFCARTSRKHGITEGTMMLLPQVREVNKLLQLMAPHASWMSFALVSHHDVDWHCDSMNSEQSYVVTVNGVRAYLEVDTDVRCMRRGICSSDRSVYFDATRRHKVAVSGKRHAVSFVMCSPARIVPQRYFDGLVDAGFPIGVEGGVYPFAQAFAPVHETSAISPKRNVLEEGPMQDGNREHKVCKGIGAPRCVDEEVGDERRHRTSPRLPHCRG